MKKALTVLALGCLVLLGKHGDVQAADPSQGDTPPAQHMPMQGGQTPASPQGTDPHVGHAMPGGMGMMGHMHCPMMQGMQHNHSGAPASTVQGDSVVTKAFAEDPVCGMEVETTEAKAAGLTLEYQGRTYYFCSETCKEQFAKNPRP